jgi:preprotein translocase subunit YajC
MADRASQQAWLAVLIAVAMMAIVWFFVWRAFGRNSIARVNPAAE